jgi:hypothetical protein
MDAVTYPDPSVLDYLERHFVPFRAVLDERPYWQLFRANHVIWTPTTGFLDRNGAMHYHAPGYLEASEMQAVMMIGRARCLMAWTRAAEAAEECARAAALESSFAAEALWWQGAAHYLERRDSKRMWEPWDRLVALYPTSPWAARVYDRNYGRGVK